MVITHLMGCFLIDARGAFLNGSESITESKEEISVPKSFELNGINYPYISAQCWRKWWKEAFQSLYLPITDSINEEKKYKDVPFLNSIEDIFGYFESIERKINFNDINKTNVSQIRSSPMQMTHLQPIKNINSDANRYYLNKDKAYIHLDEGTPLPYTSKFYNAFLEALFSIDLNRIGRYRCFNDRRELTTETIQKYIKKDFIIDKGDGSFEIKDINRLLPLRLKYMMKSLFFMFGGAKSAQYAVDINPKFIIFSGAQGANNIFANTLEIGVEEPKINLKSLYNRISKNPELIKSPIYIGLRKGIINDFTETELIQKKLEENLNINLVIGTPFECINKFIEGLVN